MGILSNVKVVSDGIHSGTRVTVGGVEVEGVTSIEWTMKSVSHIGELTLKIEGAEVDVDALRLTLERGITHQCDKD